MKVTLVILLSLINLNSFSTPDHHCLEKAKSGFVALEDMKPSYFDQVFESREDITFHAHTSYWNNDIWEVIVDKKSCEIKDHDMIASEIIGTDLDSYYCMLGAVRESREIAKKYMTEFKTSGADFKGKNSYVVHFYSEAENKEMNIEVRYGDEDYECQEEGIITIL